ncbi:MAG: hypothetical protein AABY64_01695 [Bdellovibrionota bacterium]
MSKLQNETYLIKILDLMRDDIENSQRGEFFHKFYDLKEQSYTTVSPEVIRLYKNILRTSVKKFKADKSMNNILSATISLSHNLIPTNLYDIEIDEIFNICLNLDDSRTKANVLTALGEYNPESPLFKDYFDSQSNRVAADALAVEAKKTLSDEILDRIDLFLASTNPYFVASGIYLIARLTEYFSEKNNTEEQKKLARFFPIISKFSTHPHEMIRKRALKSMPAVEILRKSA